MIITICIGSSCHLKGSKQVVDTLEQLITLHKLEQKVHLTGSFCLNHCVTGVSVKLDDTIYSLTTENTEHFFVEHVLPFYKNEPSN